MPYIKGGGDAQVESLRSLLRLVQEDPTNTSTIAAVDRGRPRGFVERAGRGLWKVTEQGLNWLETSDNAYLIGVFHSEIRFIGELLEQLDAGPLTHSQLTQIAKDEYDLPWGSMDQVRRRTTWARASGFLELRFDNYLVLTDSGRELLGRLDNHPPKSAEQGDSPKVASVTIPAANPTVAAFVADLDQAKLRKRKRLMGYMPGGATGIDAIRTLVTAATPSISKEQWMRLCADKFNVIESSASQAIGSFRGCGLIEQVARDEDSASALGQAWIESDEDLDLIRIVHGHIRFFGELLSLLTRTGDGAELAARALDYQIPAPDMQRRLGLLVAAGLVEDSGVRRFRLSAKGEAFLAELPLEQEPLNPSFVREETSEEERAEPTARPKLSTLMTELREAGRAANDHKRLERAVAAAFAELGFTVEHLGGQGRTDVRAVSPLPSSHRFTIIADAKASAKGQVLPFDVVTLREHKGDNKADAVIAVGESFADKRTIERAETEGVGLVSIGLLCQILELAAVGNIGVSEIRDVMSITGAVPDDAAKLAARTNRRLGAIAKSVLSALAIEAAGDDEVTKGALSSSEIYMLLRAEVDAPALKDITMILELLAGPLVRGINEAHDKYVLCEHVPIIAARLRNLGVLLADASTGDDVAGI